LEKITKIKIVYFFKKQILHFYLQQDE